MRPFEKIWHSMAQLFVAFFGCLGMSCNAKKKCSYIVQGNWSKTCCKKEC